MNYWINELQAIEADARRLRERMELDRDTCGAVSPTGPGSSLCYFDLADIAERAARLCDELQELD
jgi:hypothetical protein